MVILIAKRACQANNPATCRHHGMPLQKLEDKLNKVKTSKEYIHIKKLIQDEKNKAYLDALPKEELVTSFRNEELTVEQHSTKPHYDGSDWTNLWVSNNQGEAIGFIKVHVHKTEDGSVERVAVCDVETNPKFRGQNAALALFRKIKIHYGINALESGETYSEKGHAMFRKLRGHELVTGEIILKMDKWTAPREHEIEGRGSHSFVQDWNNKIPKFRL